MKKSNVIKLVMVLGFAVSGYSQAAESVVVDGEANAAPVAVVADAPVKAAEVPETEQIFAEVEGKKLTLEDFEIEMGLAVRTKFYHGNAPKDQLAELQREVGLRMVNDVLLVKEARRRGLKPDEEMLKERLAQIDERNSETEQWKENRDHYLPKIREKLENESLLAQLEDAVRAVTPPTDEQVKAYYEKHPEKFTEPEQLRISVILLTVDPSSPGSEWVKAFEFARGLVKQLRDEGADFAALAKEFSGEQQSAEYGGDMGYLHDGMLPSQAQTVLDDMEIGDVSEPVRLLEGVAVFKLTDRAKAQLGSLEKVKNRAADLWAKEEGERVWADLIAKLRGSSSIKVEEKYYLPLPVAKSEPVDVAAEPEQVGAVANGEK